MGGVGGGRQIGGGDARRRGSRARAGRRRRARRRRRSARCRRPGRSRRAPTARLGEIGHARRAARAASRRNRAQVRSHVLLDMAGPRRGCSSWAAPPLAICSPSSVKATDLMTEVPASMPMIEIARRHRGPRSMRSSAAAVSASKRCRSRAPRMRSGCVSPRFAGTRRMRDRHQQLARDVQRHMALVAEPLVGDDLGLVAPPAPSRDAMRPHADHDLAPARRSRRRTSGPSSLAAKSKAGPFSSWKRRPFACDDRGVEDVHRRLADEGGDEQIGGPVLQFLLAGELLQHAALHHRDAVGERIGLGLVVGDEDRGHAPLDEQALQPAAQHRAQLRLELAHRLVEQVEVGPAHQRAGEAGALLLAARDRGGIAVEDRLDLDQRRDLGDRLRDLARRDAARSSARRRCCRARSAADRANSPRRPWRRCAAPAASCSMRRSASVIAPVRDLLEARDHAQRRGLAAAGRAEQRDDLALADVHVERLDRMDRRLAAAR